MLADITLSLTVDDTSTYLSHYFCFPAFRKRYRNDHIYHTGIRYHGYIHLV